MSKVKKILNSYMLHQYPEQVRDEFAEWFSSPVGKEEKDTMLSEQWSGIEAKGNKFNTRRSYESVMGKIHTDQRRVRRVAILRGAMQFAAVIIFALTLFFSVREFANKYSDVEWQEVYASAGENKTVTLSDGSTLALAAGSRLIYPSSFEGDVRKVYLCGEAYADIAKDELRRFVVSTEQIDVVVHGTKFNVRSYESGSEVEVMLLNGSVDMQTKHLEHNRVVCLHPGDLIKLDKRSGRITYESIPKDMFESDPASQRLTFINSRLGDIAMQLERQFGVQITIDQASLAESRFYSAFVNNESLDRILSTLEQSGRMRYYRKNGTIHLCK